MDTHVTVAGNLTDHPELRFTATGDQVCRLRVAVTARAPDGQGGRDRQGRSACLTKLCRW